MSNEDKSNTLAPASYSARTGFGNSDSAPTGKPAETTANGKLKKHHEAEAIANAMPLLMRMARNNRLLPTRGCGCPIINTRWLAAIAVRRC